MINVEPRVYLLAEPVLIQSEVAAWLADVGADAQLVMDRMGGSDAEKLIELSARRCYKSFQPGLNPNVTKIREDSRAYHENILKVGHGSVMEHANFTVAFEFVSRVFTHELVRHRAGCAYSQESLRYVRLTELGFWIPPIIAKNAEANAIFVQAVTYLESCQKKLGEIFAEAFEGDFALKKKMTSAFRRIAPIGLATGIVATFNARAFRHIAKMRTELAAEDEIRIALDKACKLIFPRHPFLFQDFEKGALADGVFEQTPKFKKV